jgi:hypothetical protein
VSNLKQWREALEANPSNGRTQYYHAEMMNLLEAGEKIAEAARRFHTAHVEWMKEDEGIPELSGDLDASEQALAAALNGG